MRRRQDLLGEPGGVRVYDDFAHHPTAVDETLRALRAGTPTGALWAAFEPRSATACRALHQDAYARAFDAADRVLLAPLGRTDVPEAERLDLERLARDSAPRRARCPRVDAIVARIAAEAAPATRSRSSRTAPSAASTASSSPPWPRVADAQEAGRDWGSRVVGSSFCSAMSQSSTTRRWPAAMARTRVRSYSLRAASRLPDRWRRLASSTRPPMTSHVKSLLSAYAMPLPEQLLALAVALDAVEEREEHAVVVGEPLEAGLFAERERLPDRAVRARQVVEVDEDVAEVVQVDARPRSAMPSSRAMSIAFSL